MEGPFDRPDWDRRNSCVFFFENIPADGRSVNRVTVTPESATSTPCFCGAGDAEDIDMKFWVSKQYTGRCTICRAFLDVAGYAETLFSDATNAIANVQGSAKYKFEVSGNLAFKMKECADDELLCADSSSTATSSLSSSDDEEEGSHHENDGDYVEEIGTPEGAPRKPVCPRGPRQYLRRRSPVRRSLRFETVGTPPRARRVTRSTKRAGTKRARDSAEEGPSAPADKKGKGE